MTSTDNRIFSGFGCPAFCISAFGTNAQPSRSDDLDGAWGGTNAQFRKDDFSEN